MNHYYPHNHCNGPRLTQQNTEHTTQKKYFNHPFKNISNVTNLVNNHHNHHKNRQYSFKFEHIIDSVFSSDNKGNNSIPQQYSNRLFLGNQASPSIKLHFQKKYHSRNHRHSGSGGISIPEDLYQEMKSLQSQILNLLAYEYNNNANINGHKNRKKIIDIHTVYLQKNECLGILIYYEYNHKYNNNLLNIFNKYFNVVEFIDNHCYKYWQCPNVQCQYRLNKIKNIKESIFFCEKCKFDFTFHHNPNNHYHISFNNSSNCKSTKTNALNNKRFRSCIKYRFLSFQHINSNNVTTMNLFHEMSHQKFQQLTITQQKHRKHQNKEIETGKNKQVSNIPMDWTDELMLNNLEKWFDHKPGTKIGLNDYNFDVGNVNEDTFEQQINNVRCRESEGERHGVDHHCIACKPWLLSEFDEEYETNTHNKYVVNNKKSWLCSLCQKSIPIDIKTCICISYENKKRNKNKHKLENGHENKDCLIVIKELAETLHATISFNEIPQEFKTSSKPFEYEICFNGEIIANGHGNSKRKAQRNGAQIALDYLSKRGCERKINLLQRFGRIGHSEIDRNLYVEVCRDISDETNIYSVLSAPYSIASSNHENIFEYVTINESPEIVAYKTRVCEISQLDEPSVLGCLDVCGPLKFSLVAGIFHKDVNNGRYGYKYKNRNKKNTKKKKKRKRKRNNNKLSEDKAINTNINPDTTHARNEQVIERNKNMYSHPSKYEYHEIYGDGDSPQLHKHSKRRRKKREKEKEKKKNGKLAANVDGVYICDECGKYYADGLNGKCLSTKWFCFDCNTKITEKNHNNHLNSFIESAFYTQRKNKDQINQPTPPMTPPSSDDDNNQKHKETNDVSLYAPYTPPPPPSIAIKMENINNELADNDSNGNIINSAEEIVEAMAKTIETVSIATQVNCYNDNIYNIADKAIQVSGNKLYKNGNHNKWQLQSLHVKYKEKYLNNIRINSSDYNYIQQPQRQQHILFDSNHIQNSWNAYYGEPHRNMLLIHHPSMHSHSNYNSRSHSHRNRYNHHSHSHRQQRTDRAQPQSAYAKSSQCATTTTTINGYQTFQCSAYSNINHI